MRGRCPEKILSKSSRIELAKNLLSELLQGFPRDSRFYNREKFLKRLKKSFVVFEETKKEWWRCWWQFKEAANEAVLVREIFKKYPNLTSLRYEELPHKIDFSILTEDKEILIEVKSVNPEFNEKEHVGMYKNFLKDKRFPEHINYDADDRSVRGVYVSRQQFVRNALKLEHKITKFKLSSQDKILAFCNNNGSFDEEDLKNFAFQYKSGAYSIWDVLSRMDSHEKTHFKKTIDQFVFLQENCSGQYAMTWVI